MIILGVDPGSRLTGWGILEARGPAFTRHVDNGVIALGNGALPARLLKLMNSLEMIVSKYGPNVVAVEGVFTAKNARSALVLGHARGVALLVAAKNSLDVFEYAPAKIKKAIAGSGRAEKFQVQTALQLVLGLPEPAQADAADALAVAFCHASNMCREKILKGVST
ncbi:MAG: crossover junction endodeoxyribonuclease RuvC [Deltaproteobacteria bacterium]|nr:crossover junction endodeoxyribonuclease RuvC [Deltaproteobacteria bacterium]